MDVINRKFPSDLPRAHLAAHAWGEAAPAGDAPAAWRVVVSSSFPPISPAPGCSLQTFHQASGNLQEGCGDTRSRWGLP
jgi:hypothetical protein